MDQNEKTQVLKKKKNKKNLNIQNKIEEDLDNNIVDQNQNQKNKANEQNQKQIQIQIQEEKNDQQHIKHLLQLQQGDFFFYKDGIQYKNQLGKKSFILQIDKRKLIRQEISYGQEEIIREIQELMRKREYLKQAKLNQQIEKKNNNNKNNHNNQINQNNNYNNNIQNKKFDLGYDFFECELEVSEKILRFFQGISYVFGMVNKTNLEKLIGDSLEIFDITEEGFKNFTGNIKQLEKQEQEESQLALQIGKAQQLENDKKREEFYDFENLKYYLGRIRQKNIKRGDFRHLREIK
ncbi:hypothetical protein PPERSA_07248 [Pseudocohnilembus persalinus]|uniref:Uncharacterized protein n=1 Tax=Pseudocohnilembus persalinus TaxID=266149 RepID=A0A0V0QCW7_PSEPJ|nr:hypothetical protein PPERSA_07248 [Pseudocohnilembus persalinus]|eukprot:KRX00051.1 hypothetical protein PPERSA_07248 [Pseudocohnilembus persalinus]